MSAGVTNLEVVEAMERVCGAGGCLAEDIDDHVAIFIIYGIGMLAKCDTETPNNKNFTDTDAAIKEARAVVKEWRQRTREGKS